MIHLVRSRSYRRRLIANSEKCMKVCESPLPLRIGLFGIGLDAYWPQFPGLKERLEGYLSRVAEKLQLPGVESSNLGLIDTPEKAAAAGHRFRQADVDLLFLHVTTYALSSTVLPVVRRAKVPVIIAQSLARAGDRLRALQLDWATARAMTGEWLAHCAACPVPEIANVFNRARIPFHQVTGMLDDDPALLERGRRRGSRPPASRTPCSTTGSA